MRAELRIPLYTCLTVLTIAVQGYAQPQYTLTDLGAFRPNAIAGPWVVGEENNLPTRLNLDTGEKLTLRHRGFGGIANAVIATGQAVGLVYRSASAQDTAATFWDATGVAYSLPGPLPSVARDLNDALTVAGTSGSCPGGPQAVRWYPTQGLYECLTGALGTTISNGRAIDGQDRVWGTLSGNTAAVVWEVGQAATPVTHNGNIVADVLVTGANEVLAVGRVGFEPVHYRFPPALTLLPKPTERAFCYAWGVNTANATVGSCIFTVNHAMLWPDTASVIDLNTRVQAPFVLGVAIGINDDGEIVGVSAEHNWLLTPVPPSLAISLNQGIFNPGDTLRAALTMDNPGGQLTVDQYVGIILTDGQTILWLTHTAPLAGVLGSLGDNPATFTPMLCGVNWPAGMHVTQTDYFTYRVTGLEANGTYYLVVAWTKPNSLEDGRIDEGDILALDWKAFRFTGPASTPAAKVQEIRARHATE
jgi:hypothetical protein